MTRPLDADAEAHVREIVTQEVSRFGLLILTRLAAQSAAPAVTFQVLRSAVEAYECGEA